MHCVVLRIVSEGCTGLRRAYDKIIDCIAIRGSDHRRTRKHVVADVQPILRIATNAVFIKKLWQACQTVETRVKVVQLAERCQGGQGGQTVML